MADKTPTITEPVLNNVTRISILCDGSGAVMSLQGDVSVTSSDASTYHNEGFSFDVSSLPAAAQTAVTTLIAECLTRFKSEHGF